MDNWTLIARVAPAALVLALVTACADAPVAPTVARSALTPLPAALAADSYTPVELFPDATGPTAAFALNDRGQVAVRDFFVSEGAERGRAYLWTPDGPNAETGQATVLKMPFGTPETSHAFDINNRGVVVGSVVGPFGGTSAVVWTTDIGTPLSGTKAVAINNRGYVVTQNGSDASLWTPPGTSGAGWQAYPLGSFTASAINDRGDIVGVKVGLGAAVWRPNEPGGVTGEFFALGSFAGGSGTPFDINDRGDIVGVESTGGGELAVLWEPTGPNATTFTVTNLNPVIDATNAFATGINNKGEVTGGGAITGLNWRTLWVWHPGGKPGSSGTVTILGSSFPSEVLTDKRGPVINSHGDVAFELDGNAILWRK